MICELNIYSLNGNTEEIEQLNSFDTVRNTKLTLHLKPNRYGGIRRPFKRILRSLNRLSLICGSQNLLH
jgi:hypothetical protein